MASVLSDMLLVLLWSLAAQSRASFRAGAVLNSQVPHRIQIDVVLNSFARSELVANKLIATG